MKTNKYPDDELIAYLMNEGGPEFRSRLARDLETDPELAIRLVTLGKISNQLRQLPLETFYSTRVSVTPLSLVFRAAILAGIFFTGVLVQSEFSILNRCHY